MHQENLKFPIGTFKKPESYTREELSIWINTIAEFPKTIQTLTHSLSVDKLNWRYRPGGWTIKQVVHHCGDSHMNSLMRFKLALTEENPKIKPYEEDLWAKLNDSLDDDITYSLNFIEGLHYRWVVLLRSLDEKQLERTFRHPEHGTTSTLAETIATYAWHCEHHLAHIKQALMFNGDFSSLT